MGLDTVELVMEIEHEFDIDIPDPEAEKIRTVGMLADFVWEQVREKVPSAALPPAPLHAPAPTSYEAVLAKVRHIVASQFGVRLGDVHPHTRFVEDLDAD